MLRTIVSEVSLGPRHPSKFAEHLSNESNAEQVLRHNHSGIESAIGGLQRGNDLQRCRDRSELGLERYLGLAVLGRNIQVLGKLLITREVGDTIASHSLRDAA